MKVDYTVGSRKRRAFVVLRNKVIEHIEVGTSNVKSV